MIELTELQAVLAILLMEFLVVSYHSSYGRFWEKPKYPRLDGALFMGMLFGAAAMSFVFVPLWIGIPAILGHLIAFTYWTDPRIRKPVLWTDWWHLIGSFPSHYPSAIYLCVKYIDTGEYYWKWAALAFVSKGIIWQLTKRIYKRDWDMNEIQAIKYFGERWSGKA